MVKKYEDSVSRFHLMLERYGRTDGQRDGQTDRFAISISRVSVLTRDKKLYDKKYVMSNSESVQCNFFISDYVTFIQFKICCCVQNFMKIG